MSYILSRRRKGIIIKTFSITFIVVLVLRWLSFVTYRLSFYDVFEEMKETKFYGARGTTQLPFYEPTQIKVVLAAVGEKLPVDKFTNDMILVFSSLIKEAESKIVYGLGDNGKAVKLSGDEEKEGELVFKEKAFNLVASNKVAYNRSIKDARHPECHLINYSSNLPAASVIIVFCNEAWSALIRTVHSVLNRTPKRLLKEIILVDDFSDHNF